MSEWQELPLGELGTEVRENVTPEEGTTYAHYSVPSFDTRTPDIEDGGAIKSNKRQLRAGDVLVCRINPRINRVWIVGEHDLPIIGSTEWVTLRLPDDSPVDRSFLLWYLRSPQFRADITSSVSGVTGSHTRAKRKKVLGYSVPVPPLDEQRAIVGIVERLLSKVVNVDETLTKAVGRGRALRRAVANRLAAEAPGEPLGDLLREDLRNGKSVRDGDGASVLRLSALRGGFIDLTDSKTGSWGDTDPTPYFVEGGDFLVSRGNGTLSLVGRGGLVRDDPPAVAFPDTMIRVRPDTSRVHPGYLRLVWDSDRVRRQIESRARTTAGIYKINQSMLKELKLPLPDLSKQVSLAEWGTRVTTHADHLVTEVDSIRQHTHVMRRSILNAAFESRLTSTTMDAPSAEELEEAIA